MISAGRLGTDHALSVARSGWWPSCRRGDFRHFVGGGATRRLYALPATASAP